MRWFKFILVLIFLAVITLFVIGLYANRPKTVLKNIVIKDNSSSFVFELSYAGFIPLGEGVFENKGIEKFNGKKVYHLKGTASPTPFLNSLYKTIEAEINSFIDKDSLNTLKYTEKTYISGKTKEEKTILYDQKNNIMERDGEERIIFPNTHDPLSLLFYLIHQDFKMGETIDLNINTNQKNYRFYGEITEKVTIETGDKSFDVYLFKGNVQRRNNSLRHSSEFSIWFIDSPCKAPFLIKVFTNAGPIVARLTKIY